MAPPRAALAALLVWVVLVYLGLDNGGFFPRSWTVAAAVLAWAAGMGIVFLRGVELTRAKLAWAGLLAAFVAWTAASTAWSVDGSATVDEVRRGLVYVAGAAALAVLARRAAAAPIVVAVWSAATTVVVYALLRYLLDPGYRDPAQADLLARPVGYANALGILAGAAALLAIGLAARPRSRTAAATLAPLSAAIALTESRATLLAVAVGLAVIVALGAEIVWVALPICAAVFLLADRSGLADGTASSPGRAGALVLLEVVLAAAALAWAPRLRLPRVAVALAALATLAAAAVWGGDLFAGGFRPSYWHVAWREYVAHPLLGSGGGTFGEFWARQGDPALAGGALDAHNLYLETLAEVGPLGLALLLAALALPLRACRRDPVAAGAYVAVLAHAALDWDWEMPVVTLAALALAGALIADG